MNWCCSLSILTQISTFLLFLASISNFLCSPSTIFAPPLYSRVNCLTASKVKPFLAFLKLKPSPLFHSSNSSSFRMWQHSSYFPSMNYQHYSAFFSSVPSMGHFFHFVWVKNQQVEREFAYYWLPHSPCQFYQLCRSMIVIMAEPSQVIMESGRGGDQPSATDINQQPNQNESLIVRVGRIGRRLSASKVAKAVLVVILITVLILLVTYNIENALLKAKKMFKYRTGAQVKEISGLDQEGYRAFYYYLQMLNISKSNVAKGKKFYAQSTHQFDGITFNQLLGVFKVVKAIQYAKNYSAFPQTKDEQQQLGDDVDPQILEKAYNYTEYFPPAANQYRCGSCYSFPITATIQYLIRKKYNISVKLSEQQIIDCSAQDESIDGCESGNITKGFDYAKRVGLVEQQNYPYRSKNGHSFSCRKQIVNDPKIKKYKIDGFRMLPKDNCQAIQLQLSQGNVVAAMIAAGQLAQYTQMQKNAFRNCPKDSFSHAITIVGQTQNQEWIVRNSWGSSWGKNGYFIMRGNNTCGVCTHTYVPYINETIPAP